MYAVYSEIETGVALFFSVLCDQIDRSIDGGLMGPGEACLWACLWEGEYWEGGLWEGDCRVGGLLVGG